MLYPVWYVLSYSLSNYKKLIETTFLLYPVGFTLEAYEYIFSSNTIFVTYGNTIFVVVVGTTLSIMTTAMLAYPLSLNIKGSKIILRAIYVTMIFSGGIIPTYIVVRLTGLINSLWSLILPVLVSPFYVFVMRGFFAGLPSSLRESATIDGAGEFKIFLRIVLPISTAVFASLSLFYAVIYWNTFFTAIIYISDSSKWTVQVFLRSLVSLQMNPDNMFSSEMTKGDITGPSIRMATVSVVMIPITLIYPFLQKYFVKGVTLGAVKG
jgi:putative aldouronate transport system permease protein